MDLGFLRVLYTSDGMNRLIGEFDSIESVGRMRFESLARSTGLAFTAIGGAITGAMGIGVKAATDFGTAMAEVNSLGVQDLGALETAVKDVSMEFGQDLVGSAKAAYQAISAGATEAQVPKLLESAAKAATAGVSDLTTAIELGTSVSNAYGKSLDNVNEIYDQAFIAVKLGVTNFDQLSASVGKVAPLFQAAGLSSAEMFASITALTKGGIQTAEAVTAMKGALTSIIKPSQEAVDLSKALGIDFSATGLKAKGLKGFLDEVGEAIRSRGPELAKLRDQLESQVAAMDEGAKANAAQAQAIKDQIDALKLQRESMKGSGQDAARLTEQIQALTQQYQELARGSRSTKEQLAELRKEFKGLEGVSDDQLTAMAALFGSVEGLNGVLALTGAQAKSFDQALTQMNETTGATDEAFQRIVDRDPAFAFRQLKSSVQVLAVEVGQALLPVMKGLLDDITPIVKATAEWIRENPNLSATLIKITAGLGGLLFVTGPVLMQMGSMLQLFRALQGIGLVSSLANAATGMTAIAGAAPAAGAGIATMTATIGTATLAMAPWIAALTLGGVLIGGLVLAHVQLAEAQEQRRESEARLDEQIQTYIEHLRARGIAVDEATLKDKSRAEQIWILNNLEGQQQQEALQRYLETIATKEQAEAALYRAKLFLLNENLTMEEAAQAALLTMTEQTALELLHADAQKTDAMLRFVGIRTQASTEGAQEIAKSETESAGAVAAAAEERALAMNRTVENLKKYVRANAEEIYYNRSLYDQLDNDTKAYFHEYIASLQHSTKETTTQNATAQGSVKELAGTFEQLPQIVASSTDTTAAAVETNMQRIVAAALEARQALEGLDTDKRMSPSINDRVMTSTTRTAGLFEALAYRIASSAEAARAAIQERLAARIQMPLAGAASGTDAAELVTANAVRGAFGPALNPERGNAIAATSAAAEKTYDRGVTIRIDRMDVHERVDVVDMLAELERHYALKLSLVGA